MKHWNVTLLRDGRIVRQWNVWAEVLTIGSAPSSAVRVPAPFPQRAATLRQAPIDSRLELGEYSFQVVDDTAERERLWVQARQRMSEASAALTVQRDQPFLQRLLLALLILAGLGQWCTGFLGDFTPQALRDFQATRDSMLVSSLPVAQLRLEAPKGHDGSVRQVGPSAHDLVLALSGSLQGSRDGTQLRSVHPSESAPSKAFSPHGPMGKLLAVLEDFLSFPDPAQERYAKAPDRYVQPDLVAFFLPH